MKTLLVTIIAVAIVAFIATRISGSEPTDTAVALKLALATQQQDQAIAVSLKKALADNKAVANPFSNDNAATRLLPPTCKCGDNCAGGSSCPGNCTSTTCANPVAKVDGGCTCGCQQTGKCNCKNCDVGNKGAYPHCTCGCTDTGSCTCHDCNHPKAAATTDRTKVIESDQPGNPWILQADGEYYRYTQEQLRQMAQPQMSQPSPIRTRFFSGSGCSSGG